MEVVFSDLWQDVEDEKDLQQTELRDQRPELCVRCEEVQPEQFLDLTHFKAQGFDRSP
jgi:hypothetical protein